MTNHPPSPELLADRARAMLNDLDAQNTSTALARRLRRYTKPVVLLIDEVGYLSYDSRAADLLFEVVSRRHEHRPIGRFGWLEDRLLRDGWLARLGPEGTSVLVLMALAADRQGASFHGPERVAERLGMSRQDVDQALTRLLELRLVAHRPWRQGHPDGIWQLLPLPTPQPRGCEAVSLGDLFKPLRLQPQSLDPRATTAPPDSRAS